MARTFAKDAIMAWNGFRVSDHNRSELGVDYERIETATRMANGTMRKYVVADKRSFSVSWDDLPNTAANTVDGFWGGQEILTFYKENAGVFNLTLTYGNGTKETIPVIFDDFSYDISKRGRYDMWNVNVGLVEV